jgi:hypothetical protein
LLEITWQRLITGSVTVILDQVHLTDPNDRILPVVIPPTDDQVQIMSGFVLRGQVTLQGTDQWSGVTVATAEQQIQTDANGQFDIGVDGEYQLTLTTPGYLSARAEGNPVELNTADAETINLGRIVLLGGEVTGDDQIDVFDLAFIGGRYGSHDPQADITGDGVVDIFDLALSAANYGQRGPIIVE